MQIQQKLKKNKFENFQTFIDKKLILTKKLEVKVMPTTLIIKNGLFELSRVEGYINWQDEGIINEIKGLL